MEGASVRNIAKEAGLSPGALRHDFSSQEELLRYAMNLVKERVTERIIAISGMDLPSLEKVLRILQEVVPTREETRAEAEVWMAFTAHFRHKPGKFDARHDGLYDLMQRLITTLDQHRLLQPGLDPEMETVRLHALIDGLTLHALLDPLRVGPDQINRVLKAHLDSITNAFKDQ